MDENNWKPPIHTWEMPKYTETQMNEAKDEILCLLEENRQLREAGKRIFCIAINTEPEPHRVEALDEWRRVYWKKR